MSAASPRARVLSAYRTLFRARSRLFRGDEVALRESRSEIRSHFVQNASFRGPDDQLESLLLMANEAADMMRHGIVQGRLNDRTGHYEVKFEPEHMIEDTSHVEPITHETVKKLQKPMVEQQKGGKCNSTSN